LLLSQIFQKIFFTPKFLSLVFIKKTSEYLYLLNILNELEHSIRILSIIIYTKRQNIKFLNKIQF